VGNLNRRAGGRASADDNAEHALSPGQPAGRLEGVVVVDLDDLGDEPAVQDAGMKPAPRLWMRCGAGVTGWPAIFCVMTGLLTGSTAMALKLGLRCLMCVA
jgi:hypothetical protein